MNRPDSLNAFDDDLHAGLPTALREAESDREARVIVLTGAGRAFSAGGNVDDFALLAGDLELRRATLRTGRRLFEDLIGVQLPVIAAVNGPAVGLGCTIATACDSVLVSDQAFLADPHVQVALVAGDGGAITWPLSVGLLRAKQYLLTGDRISPEVAVELGLATRAVPADSLMDEARAGAPHRGAAAAGRAGHQGRPEPASAHGCGHLLELRARSREPVTRHSRVPRSARHVPRTEGIGQWTSQSTTSRPSCRRSCVGS